MATKNKLKYGQNQFLSKTKGSHDKAVKLLTRHVAILVQYVEDFPLDTDYPILLARTQTPSEDANTKFHTIFSKMNTQVSKNLKSPLVTKGIFY